MCVNYYRTNEFRFLRVGQVSALLFFLSLYFADFLLFLRLLLFVFLCSTSSYTVYNTTDFQHTWFYTEDIYYHFLCVGIAIFQRCSSIFVCAEDKSNTQGAGTRTPTQGAKATTSLYPTKWIRVPPQRAFSRRALWICRASLNRSICVFWAYTCRTKEARTIKAGPKNSVPVGKMYVGVTDEFLLPVQVV